MSELSKARMARLVRAARRRRQYVAAVAVFVAGSALCTILPWYPRGGIVGILFLTGMLAIHLFRLAARNVETSRLAVELAEANCRLEKEMADRKQAEATLWASEIKHKTLYDLSSDAILLFDPEKGFISGNHACIRLFGCKDEDEFRVKTTPDLWSPDYQPDGAPSSTKSREMIAIALRNGRHSFEWKYKRLNGSDFLANVLLARMDIEGKTYLQATVRDISEQRWTQKMLQASERHYRLLAENISEVIWSIEPSGRYTYVSPTIRQQQGYTPEEFFESTIDEFLPPMAADSVRQHIADIAVAEPGDRGKSESLELEIRRKDGSTFWGEMTFSGMYDEAGELVSIQGTTRDISERKRVQKALQESERRFADMIDFLPDATFAIDRNGKVIAWNRAIEKMTGVSADAMLGKCDYAYAVPFYGEARPILVDLVFAEDKTVEREYQSIRRDGAQLISESFSDRLCGGKGVHLWGVASPLYDSNGCVVGAIESIRDITELKHTQEELQQSERRFLNVLHASDDAMLLIEGGKFVDSNDATAKMLGYPSADVFLGASPAELSPPLQPDGRSSRERADEMMDIAARRGSHHFEWIHRKADGQDFPVEVTLTAIVAHGKNQLLCVWRDITEQKRSQKALEESERRLATIINFLPDATLAIDRRGHVIAWNHAIEEITGVPASEMLGKGDYAYSVPLYGKAEPILVDLLFEGHEGEWKNYTAIERQGTQIVGERFVPGLRGGQGAYIWGVAAPLYDSDGRMVGAIESFRDITEQKRAEDALRASETRYKTLYDSSADAIMMRTPDRQIIAGNAAAIQLFGCKDEQELVSLTQEDRFEEYQPDGSRSVEKAERMIEIALREGRSVFEWRYKRKTGGCFDAIVSLTPLVLDGKSYQLTTVRDITEQKRAEEAVRASETKYRTLYDSSRDSIMLMTPDGEFFDVNRRALSLFGSASEKPLPFHTRTDISPEFQPDGVRSSEKARELIAVAMREGSHTFQWRHKRSDGSEFDSTVSLTRMEIEGKNVLLVTVRDITEQKRAEEALRASERLYRLLVQNVDVGITFIDKDYSILKINAAQCRMFGKPPEEFVGKKCYREFEKRDIPCAHCPGTRAMATGQPARVETTGVRDDGTTFAARVGACPVIDEDGTVTGFIELVEDFTEDKRIQDAIAEENAKTARLAAQLAETNRLLERENAERRQAEADLLTSQTKYKTLFDASSDAILLRTLDRHVVGANQSAVALFGCKEENELVSLDPAEMYAEYQPDGRLSSEKAPEMVEIALRDGSYSFEWKYRRRDGTEFLGNVLWTTMELEGRPILLTTIRDITEQRRAEEALRNSERQLRLFADNVTDVIWRMDLTGQFTYFSPSVTQMLGLKWDEGMRVNIQDIVSPLSLSLIRERLAGVIAAAQRGERLKVTEEIQLLRADGSTIRTEINTSGTFDEAGNLVGLLGVTRDITERRRAEEALRASQTQYKTLFEASSDAIMLLGENGFICGNRAAIAMFGYDKESDMLGLTPASASPERQPDGSLSATKADEMIAIAMREGSHSFSWLQKRKDGAEFFTDVTLTKMELEGKPVLLTTERDITAKRLAQEALAASERRLRIFADNVKDVIWTTDLNARFTYLSPSVERLIGLRWEDGMNVSLADIVTPESLINAWKAIDLILADAATDQRWKPRSVELELLRTDGTALWVDVTASVLRDESDKIVGLVGVTRDITDRKEAEEERKLATERMESLLALSHMADKPVNEIIAAVVEDAIRMTQSTIGYLATANEDETVLTMEYWSKSAHADCRVIDKPLVYPMETVGLWGEAVRQRQPIVTNDYAAPNPLKRGIPDGHVPVIRHMNIPVFDGRKIVAVAGVGNKPTDYNERDLRQLQLLMEGWWRMATHKRYELNLAKARDEAQAANRAKSHFLATMSHEIRTPMTAILGYADLLMDPLISPSNRTNYATTIRRSGEHLLALINDILDLSKIEAGRMSLEWGRCNVVSLLADVASLLRPRAEQRGVELSVDYPGAIPQAIHTDSARLRQAIINLAGNAVKFTERGSVRIVVAFLPDGCNGRPAVRFEVIDTGIGIPREFISQLFQPFSQGDASITQRFGGTGLGLAISHHIADLLGGTLTVTSVLGEGSTFVLTVPTGTLEGIPMIQNPTEVMQEDIAKNWTPEAHDLTGVRVLLAEDGYDNRELIQAVLQRVGASVETAENGRIALNKAKDDMFDVILMDMNMPEMDGYEATGKLRDLGYDGPIVALTANAMVGDGDRCKVAGCDEYLTKPIDRALLIQTIAECAETRKAARPAADRPAERRPESETPATPPAPTRNEDAMISEFIDDPAMAPIIERFVGRLADQLEAMHQTLAARQYEDLRRLAHKLKGAGGSYGYPLLTETSRALEEAAKMQDGEAAGLALRRVAEVARAVQKAFLGTIDQK